MPSCIPHAQDKAVPAQALVVQSFQRLLVGFVLVLLCQAGPWLSLGWISQTGVYFGAGSAQIPTGEKPFGGEAALSQERLTWVHHPSQLGRERREWRGREGGCFPAIAQHLLKQPRNTHYPWLISTSNPNLAVPGTAQSPHGWVSHLSLREQVLGAEHSWSGVLAQAAPA